MIRTQVSKIFELESYGWVMDEKVPGTQKLLCGLPVTMRNQRRDLALVYADGTMRSVEYYPTLARTEDFYANGKVKPSADASAAEKLRELLARIFGGFLN